MILWYFNHKAGGAYRPDCFTVRNTKITQKSQSEFYTIADVTGVSTGQVTDGYHNVSKMSNGQFRYSAHFTCYPSAIPNGNIVGYLPESANPYQIVYEYTILRTKNGCVFGLAITTGASS